MAWLRTRRWLIALYAAVGLVWWWMVEFHDSPMAPAPLDTLDVVWISGVCIILGSIWLWAIFQRRSWPPETLGFHAIVAGDLVLYGVLSLARRQGWMSVDLEVMSDLLRSSVSVGSIVLGWDRLRAALRWWRSRGRSVGWGVVPAPAVTLAALSQAMPLVFADDAGVIRNATASVERLAGYRLDELLGRDLTVLIPERFHAAHRAGMARYLATGESAIVGSDTALDVVLLRKDGTEIPASLVLATIVEDGRRWFVGGLTRRVDVVSEQAERGISATERLAEATERLANTADDVVASGDAGRSATATERIADAGDALAGGGKDE